MANAIKKKKEPEWKYLAFKIPIICYLKYAWAPVQ